MSGTVTAIDTPVVGTIGGSSLDPGSDGGAGQSEDVGGTPFGNEDFTALIPYMDGQLSPDVVGGAGGGGYQGKGGPNGTATVTFDANDNETINDSPGSNAGPGGSGGAGGDATLQMIDDTLGAVGSTAKTSLTLNAGTQGGAGGSGAAGGVGGSGGSNGFGPGPLNPNNGDPTTITQNGAAGGNGGAGGNGAVGGAADTQISGLQSYCADGTTLDVAAGGGLGGAGGLGFEGADGGDTSAGGAGGSGGFGGNATSELVNSTLADDFPMTVFVYAIGGHGGTGGLGGGGGVATSNDDPFSTYTTANGAAGGDGGDGGNATAELIDTSLTAPLVSVDLYALAGAGGTAGPGGSGGIGVSTSLTKYNNGDTGPAGNSGAAGSGLLVFTGNAITVGTSIPGDANHATLNELDLTLDASVRVGTTATPVSLDGGAGGNLVFSGNHLVGTGASTLDLQLAGSGSATIDTVADTLGIDGSPGNSMTGFDSFTLDNNDTFYAGVGNYVVQYASDPDTLVYSQTSGNVTLEGVTSANMLLDFEGFGSSLTAQTLAGDITTSGGGTFIDVTGHSSIELLGYTGAIPGGDVAFTPACFLAGTRVATARGPVAVEDLAVGDRVALARRGGRSRPVVWLGHRRIDCRRHPRPMDVWPIRVAGGAFGAGRPRRDLLLSPDHAVFWRGVLIPVRHLVNGASIVQEQLDEVTYWHVELDRHDVILAEGLPCESYLDTGNRDAFENGGTVVRMHPDFARHMWDAESCAPLVVAGPDLDRVRARLHERGDRGIVNPRDGDLGARGAFVPDRERTAGKIRRA